MTSTSPPTMSPDPVAPALADPWPVMQHHVDAAHAFWEMTQHHSEKSISFLVLINLVSGVQEQAMLIGKMNYQVCNGGFPQWADNAYIDEHYLGRLIRLVRDIGSLVELREGESAAVSELTKILVDFRALAARYRVFGGTMTDRDHEYYYPKAQQLSDRYYKINEAWMDLAERYFASRFPIRDKPDQISHREALREVLDSLGALGNPSELGGRGIDDRTQQLILEAAERPE